MEFTGERFLPHVGGEIRQEHLHRYALAATLVAGKVVLDAACGEGYGSDMLAVHASQVIGVDLDEASVAYASRTYKRKNLKFRRASVLDLPLPKASVDVVVSFETLEHLAEQEEMVAEFARVLRPDGLLIISTPNRVVYSGQGQAPNPFHVKELDLPEFQALLDRHFRKTVLVGQRLATGSAIHPIASGSAPEAKGRALALGHDQQGVFEGMVALESPTYFIMLATNGTRLPRVPPSFLVSGLDDLYLDFRRIARWASGIDKELRAAQADWALRSTALEATAAELRQALTARADFVAPELLNEAHQKVALLEQELDQARAALAANQVAAEHARADLQTRLGELQAALAEGQLQNELASAEARRWQQEAEAARVELVSRRTDLASFQVQAREAQASLVARCTQAEQDVLLARHEAEAARAQIRALERDAGARQVQQAERLLAEQSRFQLDLRREAEAAQTREEVLRLKLQELSDREATQASLAQAALNESQRREVVLQQQLDEADARVAGLQSQLQSAELQHRASLSALENALAQVREQSTAQFEAWQMERMSLQASADKALEAARASAEQALQAASDKAQNHIEQLNEGWRKRMAATIREARRRSSAARQQATLSQQQLDATAAAHQQQLAATAAAHQQQLAATAAAHQEQLTATVAAQRQLADAVAAQHQQELQVAHEEQARLRQSLHQKDSDALARERELKARHDQDTQVKLDLHTQAMEDWRRREADAAGQAQEAARLHEAEREQLQARLAELTRAGERAATEAHERLGQLQASLRHLAEQHAAARAEWDSRTAAESARRVEREREWTAAVERQAALQLQAERDAAARLSDAQAEAQRVLTESRQRESELQALLRQRTQVATLLGRELLAGRSKLGGRWWMPLHQLRTRWSADAYQAEEARILELATGAAMLQPQLPNALLPADNDLEDLPPSAMKTNLSLPGAAPQSIDDLMQVDDDSFVKAAYLALLGRAVDDEGLQHYLRALAGGRSRLYVLADLHYSKEGRGRDVALAGFAEAMRELRMRKLPVLGRFLSGKPASTSLFRVRAELAGLRGQVQDIDGSIQERLANLEHALQVGIQGLAQHAVQADNRIENRLAQIERVMGTAVQAELKDIALQTAEAHARTDDRLQTLSRTLDVRVQQGQQLLQSQLAGVEQALQASEAGIRVRQAEIQSQSDQRAAQMASAVEAARREALDLAQAGTVAQALARFTWPSETDLWTLALTWIQSAPEDFTRNAFRFTLEREPLDYELTHFVARLADGSSRWMLVDKLLQSDEFLTRQGKTPAPQPQPASQPAAQAAAPEPAARVTELALPILPKHANPLVSVVIPIFGKLDYTLRCLRSIEQNPPGVSFEVIVVDDCSPDNSAQVLAEVSGIRLLRNAENLGFIRSCNRGAASARGEYICLLNNDTEVAPRWLDELVATFEGFPGTGYVGSKLLFPDGKLQEAGGIIWNDGSAWNYGRGQDPALPEFNYVREVDYCSGASIMIPTDVFRQLGGLDEHYLPAYCEDSDLALKVRQAGLRVLYQPLSEVIHHEGISSGTDLSTGVKAYQVVNSQKLFARWKDTLANYQANGVDVLRAKDRTSQRRVLVIDVVTPTPDQDAGSVTVVNFLLLLREMRFQVTFIPENNFLYMPDYTVALQRAGVEALYAPHVTSVDQHLRSDGSRYDLVLLWRPSVVDQYLPGVRQYCPQAKVLFHTVDLHYLRMEREAELLQDAEKQRAAAAMKATELAAIQAVDSAIVHSTHEVEVLSHEIPTDKLFVFPLIINVPGSRRPFEARSGVAYVGGYQHTPNVDAVLYFVNEVMPLLRQQLPGIRFHIIGSKAPAAVLSLASDDVIVEGFAPQLQPLLDRMRVSVAPLRYGAGIKGKVGNSMAMGLPVVASSIAVEGMQLRNGYDVLIADGPQQTADAICELHENSQLWSELQTHALDSVDLLSGPRASYRNLQALLQNLGLPVGEPLRPLRLYQDGR